MKEKTRDDDDVYIPSTEMVFMFQGMPSGSDTNPENKLRPEEKESATMKKLTMLFDEK